MAGVPYTTAAEVQAILEREDPTGVASGSTAGAVTEDEVIVASRDLDVLARLQRTPTANEGLALHPADLDPFQKNELAHAVSAQVAYRRRYGAEFFVEAQYASASSNGVSQSGKLPQLSPRAKSCLSRGGLLPSPGRVGTQRGVQGITPVYRQSQPLFPHIRRGYRSW